MNSIAVIDANGGSDRKRNALLQVQGRTTEPRASERFAARVRLQDNVVPEGRVATFPLPRPVSGFSASRSSRRCIFTDVTGTENRGSPTPRRAQQRRCESAPRVASLPAGAISSSVMLSSVNSTRSAPSPLSRHAGEARETRVW